MGNNVHPRCREHCQSFVDHAHHHAGVVFPVLNRALVGECTPEVPAEQREAEHPKEGQEGVYVDAHAGFEGALVIEKRCYNDGEEGEGGY
jgi:hypothetical protein